ncbi:DUF1385 domain-containing protein [Clostridium sp. Cult2]|uniref:DUF1385 domain-containing protein n=1 Tax=Clostridium sp. Cult2 TaxID=2079003 RepID=UPI001F330D8C|nr:DUF1385 domain-containing protein [Clostridium sp. Cult2]MCF6465028.1 DUF1385 domain-containing protein [Clostridium sp. Cult2]
MKIKEVKRLPEHITSIGGQALIEGILMRGPKDLAIAVRKPDGEIVLKKETLNTLGMRYKFFRFPLIRGVVGLVESMAFGIRALMYSAEFFEEGIEEEKKESFLDRVFKDKREDAEIVFTLMISLVFTILLFILLPSLITNFFKKNLETPFLLNLIEGLVRIVLFLIYVTVVSRMEDVGRVFEYHGAEHKTIHCYENGDTLTVENVKKYPILHPRCGTSFLFMVMIVSILVLSFFGWPNPLQRVLIRLVMLPVIAGISYEINRIIGKSSSKLAYYLSYPGLIIQKIATVKEPDESQIEVAIEALKAVLTGKKEEDLWK